MLISELMQTEMISRAGFTPKQVGDNLCFLKKDKRVQSGKTENGTRYSRTGAAPAAKTKARKNKKAAQRRRKTKTGNGKTGSVDQDIVEILARAARAAEDNAKDYIEHLAKTDPVLQQLFEAEGAAAEALEAYRGRE